MKLLAVESSSLVASAAILDEDKITAVYSTDFKKTHSQTLLPMIDEIVRMTETDINKIDAVAVSAGPGSFTGLRIGAATVKGLALALDKPVIAVPTLDALAYNIYGTDKLIVPIMDARRAQVYNGVYTFNGTFRIERESRALGIAELIDELNADGREVIFLGDGVPVYRSVIENGMKTAFSFAPAHLSRQSAAAVAALGKEMFSAGKITGGDEFSPDYLRKSQAEREKEENVDS